ncbi:hypothetical protein FRC00_011820 [Tulasnella sp. 408]|nr:hypothetical protein FRC00_011820 [Tulasnella sp. 408]
MDFTAQFNQLLGIEPVQHTSADDLLKEIDAWEWERQDVKHDIKALDAYAPIEIVDESPTLNAFRSSGAAVAGPSSSTGPVSQTVQKLRAKQNLQPLLSNLATTLLSNKSDDAITEEILELLGFEEMDLVSDVIRDRKALSGTGVAPKSDPLAQDADALMERGFGKRGKKGRHKHANHDDGKIALNSADAKQRIQDQLAANAAKPLFSGTAGPEAEVYPHVYTSSVNQSLTSSYGTKFILPLGTTRHTDELCEEVTIPPSRPIPPKLDERLIPVAELDPLPRSSFPGKTDIAMLSILRVLDQHRTHPEGNVTNLGSTINRNEFKIIYVAPMKALASEIVRKLGRRLAWLSIQVRELTGDMQMTRAEIAETQIIVTTPEKWDVVTRKPTGEGELASKVKLLIIDEVHLLNEERGAVIETIVARTLRQVLAILRRALEII